MNREESEKLLKKHIWNGKINLEFSKKETEEAIDITHKKLGEFDYDKCVLAIKRLRRNGKTPHFSAIRNELTMNFFEKWRSMSDAEIVMLTNRLESNGDDEAIDLITEFVNGILGDKKWQTTNTIGLN